MSLAWTRYSEALDKRVAQRIFTRLKAEFVVAGAGGSGVDGVAASGFILNLSAGGLFLSARRLVPPPTPLAVRIFTRDNQILELNGRVRWGLRVPPRLQSVANAGMGIELDSPTEKYLDFFASLAKAAPRAEPRLQTQLEVRFYHRELFLKEYTENLSQGGLFIATDARFTRDDELTIDLVIPDLAAPIALRGKVVYLLDATQATELDAKAGVGVQITNLDPKTAATLKTYVQKLMQRYEEAAD